MEKPKRRKACTRCHVLKMKCIYDEKETDIVCERCRTTGKDCNFLRSTMEAEILEQLLVKVESLEDSVVEIAKASPFGGKQKVFGYKRQDFLKGEFWVDRKIDPSDTLAGMIEQLATHLQVDTTGFEKQMAQKQSEDLLLSVEDIDEASTSKLLTFFRLHLARYLPVLIFNYVPRITEEMREECPLLYFTILAVSSMNHQSYQGLHYPLREVTKELADKIKPEAQFGPTRMPIDFLSLINDILACSVGAAWLCGELGYKMCLIASDLVGRLTPNVIDSLKLTSDQKTIVYFFSVMTFIMEQRYRITHFGQFEPNTQTIHQRDLYVSQYLQSIHSNRKGTGSSRGALKADANVELCAVIMDLQKKIGNTTDPNNFLEYSHELDQWLSDWICKLACSLTPTSLKPLIAAFQFVKLHLNSHAAFLPLGTGDSNKENKYFLTNTETVALDILEMIKYDSDIKRLIGFGPGFFANIFLTAIAVLAKVVVFCPYLNYTCDVPRLTDTIVECHMILLELIPYTNLEGSMALHRLGLCVDKMKKQVESSLQPSAYDEFTASFDRKPATTFDSFDYQSLWSKNLDDYDL